MSRVHGLKTRRYSFAVSINVLLTYLIQRVERLKIPAGLFASLLPAVQITAQETEAAVPLVLPAQRGLRHRTGQTILKTPSPSVGRASRVHGLTMRLESVSFFVSISKYFCSFCLYITCFIMVFVRTYGIHFLFWGDGQRNSGVPTDVLFQWRARLLQTIHSSGKGTYQASFAAGSVSIKISNNQKGATVSGNTNRLVTQEFRERYGDEAVAGVTTIL